MSSPTIPALAEALSHAAAYPHAPSEIQLQQTHISLVALVPPRVYKIKKPVELGFLDFSTLDRRRAACEDEVRLNARLCADTYVDVVPIVETDDGLRVDPSDDAGDIVEYAVKMRYLDPEHFLDRQLAHGTADAEAIDRVADTLCGFYAERPSSPEVAEAGWIDKLRVSTDENFEQTQGHVGDLLPRPVYEALQYYTDRFYDHNAALLHRRRAHGHIVNGHGDLRLEHVHLTDDRVCIYDCIEFNERFRHLDVANDIAFLAMDLDLHERSDLARRLVQRVAEALNDPELEQLIDFYKCYRAHVRAKVEGMRAEEDEVPDAERAASRAQAQRYYQWALRYAVTGNEPFVVVVFGRSGTGKSTQAATLADALGWAHVASDRARKQHAGMPLDERADEAQRQRLYTDEMTDRTYQTLRERAVERGRDFDGTVLDATYSSAERREQLRTALRDADLPYAFVELTAPDDVLRDRLAARDADTATASDARAEDFDMLNARYEPPTALEDPFHVRISTEDSRRQTTLSALKALIRLHN